MVLKAYRENSDWDCILEAINVQLSKPIPGNALNVNNIKKYYSSTPRETSIKRIRRIVAKNTTRNTTRNANQQASTSTGFEAEKQDMATIIVNNKMRYAKKSSPEERKEAKLQQAAYLDEESDNERNEVSASEEEKEEVKEKKPKKKTSKKRKVSHDAHKAHKEMCGKAMKMMSKIEKILDKFDSDSEDN